MEVDFLNILEPQERSGFMIFTQSLQDVAQQYKCYRQHKEVDEYAEIKKNPKKINDLTKKLLIGCQKQKRRRCESEIVKIGPASMGGFFAARK